MRNMHKGFTIVELIIVIIILGILAVVASPRFIDASSDARSASVQAFAGALRDGLKIVYAKSMIQGKNTGYQIIDINADNTGDVTVIQGYPRVAHSCSLFMGGLQYWFNTQIDTSCTPDPNANWSGRATQHAFEFFPVGFSSTSENCFVRYESSVAFNSSTRLWEAIDSIEVNVETSGC